MDWKHQVHNEEGDPLPKAGPNNNEDPLHKYPVVQLGQLAEGRARASLTAGCVMPKWLTRVGCRSHVLRAASSHDDKMAIGAVQGGLTMNATMLGMLRDCIKNRSSMVLYLPHHMLAIVATEMIGTETVVGYNQDFDQVQVRLDQVQAIATN